LQLKQLPSFQEQGTDRFLKCNSALNRKLKILLPAGKGENSTLFDDSKSNIFRPFPNPGKRALFLPKTTISHAIRT